MIDIGKKITFYFMQNVWKCTVFFAFRIKVCKKCYYEPKNFFLEKYQYGYQKNAEFYADSKMPLTKVKSKKPRKNAQKRKYSKFA